MIHCTAVKLLGRDRFLHKNDILTSVLVDIGYTS